MNSADRGTVAHEIVPVAPVPQKQKRQWITGRSILILGAGAIALHLLQEFTFGPSAAGSFIANTLQIFCAGVAAAACFAAMRRGTGFTRPFWLLIGLSFIVWAAANIGWMYYESYLQISPPRDSFCHFLMDFRWIVLAMALLLEQNEDCVPYYFDLASLLDTLQLFIIFVLIYLGWYHVPSLHESRMLSLVRSDQIELSENFAVLTLAALQLMRARTAELRRLYGGFLLCFVPLTVGICVTDYRELMLSREVSSGTWLDLWWTVPFLFAACWAARWEQTPNLFDTRRTEQRFVSMLFENTVYAVGPLVVLMQVAELGPEYRKISFSLLGLSILAFGTRLALGKFRESQAALRLRKMNDDLVESEDRYRDLVEHSEDLVCTHDLDGNLLSVNPAPARVLGYEVSELLQVPMRDLIIPENRAHFDGYLTRIRDNGSDKGLLIVTTKTGEKRAWEYSNTLRTEGVTKPIVRGIAHDITERRRAALAMRQSEHRYRTLFEKTVAGVGIISLDGRIIDCNDAWARMLGNSSAGECRGQQIGNYYRDTSQREALLAELMKTGVFLNREWQMQRKDGTPVCFLLNTVLLNNGVDEPLIQSTMMDITERKQAEDARLAAETALRISEEHFRLLVEQASDGIFLADARGQLPGSELGGDRDAGLLPGENCYNSPSLTSLCRKKFPESARRWLVLPVERSF